MTQALYRKVIDTMHSHEMYNEPCGSMMPLNRIFIENRLSFLGCCSSALKNAFECDGDCVGDPLRCGKLIRLRAKWDCDELVVLGVAGISIRFRILPVRMVNRRTKCRTWFFMSEFKLSKNKKNRSNTLLSEKDGIFPFQYLRDI